MRDEDKTKEQLIDELVKLRRRNIEAVLQEERDKAQKYLDVAGVMFVVIDADQKVSLINRKGCEVLGYSQEEIIGRNWFDNFLPEAIRDKVKAVFEELMAGSIEPVEYYENSILTRSGEERIIAWHNTVLTNKAGKVVGTLSSGEDITERKRMEERIEHLSRVLRSVRNVNQLITREKDRERLVKDVCDRLIGTRGYCSAWIALLDDLGRFTVTTEAGLGEDFLPIDERLKRGEVPDYGRRALSQPDVVVIKDTFSTHADCPLKARCAGEAIMTVRLAHGGKVYGLLSVSMPARFIIGEEELSLFKEVSEDIAFALHDIELEEQRRQAEKALRGRVKELTCLYSLSDLVEKQGVSLAEILCGTIDLVSAAWQYPEDTCARIVLEGQTFTTSNFEETIWRQSADIIVHGDKVGLLEVFYLTEKPEADEGPFLKEERNLIDSVAERLGMSSNADEWRKNFRRSPNLKPLVSSLAESLMILTTF